MREHEREIEQVESDWRDEVVDARGQVEELKDVGYSHASADIRFSRSATKSYKMSASPSKSARMSFWVLVNRSESSSPCSKSPPIVWRTRFVISSKTMSRRMEISLQRIARLRR